ARRPGPTRPPEPATGATVRGTGGDPRGSTVAGAGRALDRRTAHRGHRLLEPTGPRVGPRSDLSGRRGLVLRLRPDVRAHRLVERGRGGHDLPGGGRGRDGAPPGIRSVVFPGHVVQPRRPA